MRAVHPVYEIGPQSATVLRRRLNPNRFSWRPDKEKETGIWISNLRLSGYQ